MSGEIRLDQNQFNTALTMISRGKRDATLPFVSELNSTLPSAVKPFVLLERMLSVFDKYHDFLENDVEVCREVGKEFFKYDSQLSSGFSENSSATQL